MRLYPTFRFSMGGNEFFVTKMNASEIAETVHFASDVFQGKTLSEAIQRDLKDGRASKDIASYWRENDARFFNSIVIAAWGGGATFQPIETLNSGVPFFDNLLNADGRMHDSFGILAFDGNEQYYALDGQHRVKAIQLMHEDPVAHPQPAGFKDDEFTVIIVPTAEDESLEQFRVRYRRMFSALNRYAKPTDNATNIVMDEDDVFAILTRRLITDHPFFRWGDNDWQNERVKTATGKNLAAGSSWFTQIEVLYEMTDNLLSSALRSNSTLSNKKAFIQLRPSDTLVDAWYLELETVWSVLAEIIPGLDTEPSHMRTHNPTPDSDLHDHLWFWPIGQQMVTRVVRLLLDLGAVDIQATDETPVDGTRARDSLSVLGLLDWDLQALPWRHLILVGEAPDWRMRSEGRAPALKVAQELLLWIIGIADLGEDGVNDLRRKWEFDLYPPHDDPDVLWQRIEDLRVRILARISERVGQLLKSGQLDPL